ncbi:MAG: ATP-binding protein [Candidatus Margulisbacteria bacterium]|nr:ATP-binding protein [Candidatus Margulisiibacteriota bacterium]
MRTTRVLAPLKTVKSKATLSAAELSKNFDTVPVGLHILSSRGIILRVNATEAAMLGYPIKALVGRSFLDFIAPEQRDDAWQRFQQKLRGVKVEKKVDRTYLTKDGRRIFVTSEDRVLKGKDRRILTALIDITELKALHEQLGELQRSREIGELAAGFSHEFNNLLSAILNATTVIAKMLSSADFTSPDSAALLDIIKDCCLRGAQLNQGLICFARNTADPFSGHETSLGSIVREAVTLFEITLNTTGVTVECALEDGVVHGNEAELNSAVLNLLINARDAIPRSRPGAVRVELKKVQLRKKMKAAQGNVLAPGEYLRLSVSDNGNGIPKEIRGKVFTPFFSTKDPVAHHGLGLSMIYGILIRHKGGITLETKEDVGTTFNLFIPSVLC